MNTYDVLSVLCPWNTVMNKLVNSLSSRVYILMEMVKLFLTT